MLGFSWALMQTRRGFPEFLRCSRNVLRRLSWWYSCVRSHVTLCGWQDIYIHLLTWTSAAGPLWSPGGFLPAWVPGASACVRASLYRGHARLQTHTPSIAFQHPPPGRKDVVNHAVLGVCCRPCCGLCVPVSHNYMYRQSTFPTPARRNLANERHLQIWPSYDATCPLCWSRQVWCKWHWYLTDAISPPPVLKQIGLCSRYWPLTDSMPPPPPPAPPHQCWSRQACVADTGRWLTQLAASVAAVPCKRLGGRDLCGDLSGPWPCGRRTVQCRTQKAVPLSHPRPYSYPGICQYLCEDNSASDKSNAEQQQRWTPWLKPCLVEAAPAESVHIYLSLSLSIYIYINTHTRIDRLLLTDWRKLLLAGSLGVGSVWGGDCIHISGPH